MTWDKLQTIDQEEKVRLCKKCNLKVYDLTKMTDAEMIDTRNRNEEKTYAKYIIREDGMFMTKKCRLGRDNIHTNKTNYIILFIVTVLMIISRVSDIEPMCSLGNDSNNGIFRKAEN